MGRTMEKAYPGIGMTEMFSRLRPIGFLNGFLNKKKFKYYEAN